eukprot:jgi/Psemu1/8892/gm1.8892_g
MGSRIDLTLQGIHGAVWKPSGASSGSDAVPLSTIKAYVSFSGSVANMKVSSCAMCPDNGNLVVESETHEIVEISERDAESDPQKPQEQLLNTTFNDPFDDERLRKRLSSNDSSSSSTSGSSCRPHLQFDLRTENAAAIDDVQNENPRVTTHSSDAKHIVHCVDDSLIQLHISFRSLEGDSSEVWSEGIAHLTRPKNNFETLPVVLDLPITPSTRSSNASSSTNSIKDAERSRMFFESSAYIRVRLDDASKRQHDLSTENYTSQEYLLSDHVDEIQLVGMVKKIHEHEKMMQIRDDAAKPKLFGAGSRRRGWGLGCGGTSELKYSIQAFFEGMRGMNAKCVDPDQELVTNATMTSTIVTRESLEI